MTEYVSGRLLLAPTISTAIFAWKNDLYLVKQLSAAYALFSHLPLVVLDQAASSECMRKVQGVVDKIEIADEQARIVLVGGAADICFRVGERSKASADWIYGAFQDGWIEMLAELEVKGAVNVQFDVFLPETTAGSKAVTTVTVATDGQTQAFELQRGVISRLGPILIRNDRARVRLSVDRREKPSNNDDIRELGVIVVGVFLNEEKVIPWLL